MQALIAAVRLADGDDESPVVAGNACGVAGVTIANGADDIAVGTPIFRIVGVSGTVVAVVVFAVLIAVCCVAASWLGSRSGAGASCVDRGPRKPPLINPRSWKPAPPGP